MAPLQPSPPILLSGGKTVVEPPKAQALGLQVDAIDQVRQIEDESREEEERKDLIGIYNLSFEGPENEAETDIGDTHTQTLEPPKDIANELNATQTEIRVRLRNILKIHGEINDIHSMKPEQEALAELWEETENEIHRLMEDFDKFDALLIQSEREDQCARWRERACSMRKMQIVVFERAAELVKHPLSREVADFANQTLWYWKQRSSLSTVAFRADCIIAGHQCEVIPDYGSQRNILPPEWVEKHGLGGMLEELPNPVRVELPTGNSRQLNSRVCLSLQFEDTHIPDVQFETLQGATKPILGARTIHKLKVFTSPNKGLRKVVKRNVPRSSFLGEWRYRIFGTVDGRIHPVTAALPDTAASICIIAHHYATSLGLQYDESPCYRISLVIADGTTVKTKGIVINSTWQFAAEMKHDRQDLYVLDLPKNVDLILSSTLLARDDVLTKHPDWLWNDARLLEDDRNTERLYELLTIKWRSINKEKYKVHGPAINAQILEYAQEAAGYDEYVRMLETDITSNHATASTTFSAQDGGEVDEKREASPNGDANDTPTIAAEVGPPGSEVYSDALAELPRTPPPLDKDTSQDVTSDHSATDVGEACSDKET